MGKTDRKHSAVFIDRDGTIIREKNYLSRIKDIEILPGAEKALSLLRENGFKLVLITNQSGIGRGYFTEKKLTQIHAHLQKRLARKGADFDAIYYCPHSPDESCDCRKPKLGMVKNAAKQLNINLHKSFTIGDKTIDFLQGQNMGGKGIFVLTGHGREELKKIKSSKGALKPDLITGNILNAARWIVEK